MKKLFLIPLLAFSVASCSSSVDYDIAKKGTWISLKENESLTVYIANGNTYPIGYAITNYCPSVRYKANTHDGLVELYVNAANKIDYYCGSTVSYVVKIGT